MEELIGKLKNIFNIPFVDFIGRKQDAIKKIAIVAGGGDDLESMKEAEDKLVQAYITGEIHSYHSGSWGKENTTKINQFSRTTKMSLIAVSHSASEFLTMETQMVPYFQKTFNIEASTIKQTNWWR